MEPKTFLVEAGRLVLYSLYPLYMLYINFIFLGLFILDPKKFGDAGVLVLFIIFNIFQTFIIVYYILIFTSDSKSTQDIFPMTSDRKIERNFSNINPFIAEALQRGSIEKTHTCGICQTYKPPRCHHCSRCNKCYLKMDHHCLFLDVCIGFHNYKFFLQFLISNVIFIIFYVTIVDVDTSLTTNALDAETIVNLAISSTLSAIILVIFCLTLVFHLFLISNNETTIEFFAINSYLEGDHSYRHVFQEGPITQFSESKDRRHLNPYNLGTKENWKEIFGNSIKEWISPSFTSSGDGITFKKNTVEKDEIFFKI
ncbi:uncharacterized protein VICG_00537 [Vittaforma corneae ATCC 50505]|uniref:Palmitoyltransferase n=1 Tax=Vittaforma corneae (strain ATCC 50505) TaxID=993615 RepID=L2GNG6_VITCO|nr:uncharacterized protein VICG_00537 [Vittaforma corneae ATCC 50505]ELA42438.1 hypothetical protein VICG_00537 [Vittaforma corneae ATCC 50505]